MIYHGDHGWTLGEKYFFLSPNRSIVNDNATDKIIIVDIFPLCPHATSFCITLFRKKMQNKFFDLSIIILS